MKWEKLKEDLANKLAGNCSPARDREYAALIKVTEDDFKTKWRDNVKLLNDEIYKIVMTWDIREAGKLIELFPHEFPKKFRGVQLVADIDEKGNWFIEPFPNRKED